MTDITFTERVQQNGLWYRHNVYSDGSESWEIDEPAPVPDTLSVTLSTSQTQVNQSVTATVEIRDANGNLVPVSGTWFVPVIRHADGQQKAFLQVTLTNGSGSVSFSLPEPGVYILDPAKIRPRPASELSQPVELIVTP